jgi:tetratricopeptide (TPR) repeat protein
MRILVAIAFIVLGAGCAFGNFAELVKQGDVYDAQFKPDAALQYYLPAEKLEPNNAALLVKIARQYVYRMADQTSKTDQLKTGRTALAYAERAVKLAPNECDSHLALAICVGKLTPLLGNKEGVEASRRIKVAAETAVKLNPKNDYAWHLLGRWHQELAQIGGLTRTVAKLVYGELPAASNDEAVKCFEKAIALKPDRLIHHVELGRTYAQMGRKPEAKQYIEKGLAMPDREKDDPETKERGRKTLRSLG